MSIRIERIGDGETWNEIVERATGPTPFHRAEALAVLGDRADGGPYGYAGYNGQEPIGLFPVFEETTGPFTAVTSPPQVVHTCQLGPVTVGLDGMKRRKAERYRREFVEGCLERIGAELDPDRVHVRTAPGFGDVRPFRWNGFQATPYYTYEVDLTVGPEALLDRFSRDARSNVQSAEDANYEVTVGDREALDLVFDQVEQRHAARDAPLRIDRGLVHDLYDALPDGRVRPYVLRIDGAFAAGLLTIETRDTIYRWKGGARTEVDLPTTDLLDWHVMEDAAERGLAAYDLVGANVRRLCEYKAKFSPAVRTYYTVETSEPLYAAARNVRQLVGRVL